VLRVAVTTRRGAAFGVSGLPSEDPDSDDRNLAEWRASSTGKGGAMTKGQGDVMNPKTCTIIGSAVGLATFLAVALLPALLYGGYAGVLLAGGIFGTPVTASVLARALIVFGMVLGAVGVGGLFAVGGAAAGAAVAVLTRVATGAKAPAKA
jgi:hypothetical protein